MNGFGKAMAAVKQPFCLWGAAVLHVEGSMALDQSTWPEWLRRVGTIVQGIFQYPMGN